MSLEPWTDNELERFYIKKRVYSAIDGSSANISTLILFELIDELLVEIARENIDDLKNLLVNVEYSLSHIKDSIERLNNENENKEDV